MAKRDGQKRRTHSYKTKKRLEIKRVMLEKLALKRHGHKK